MSFQKKNDLMNNVLKHHWHKACYTRHDFGRGGGGILTKRTSDSV